MTKESLQRRCSLHLAPPRDKRHLRLEGLHIRSRYKVLEKGIRYRDVGCLDNALGLWGLVMGDAPEGAFRASRYELAAHEVASSRRIGDHFDIEIVTELQDKVVLKNPAPPPSGPVEGQLVRVNPRERVCFRVESNRRVEPDSFGQFNQF